MNQKKYCQFYSKNEIILDCMSVVPGLTCIEPFCGEGDLLKFIPLENKLELYDIDPKEIKLETRKEAVVKRDTLLDPPDYSQKYIITNPPYLLKNKTKDPLVRKYFEKYSEDDLYKCAIRSFLGKAIGGIIIIPVNFISQYGLKLRSDFFQVYRIQRINIFEFSVFKDTTTSVITLQFSLHPKKIKSQVVKIFIYKEPLREPKLLLYKFGVQNNFTIGYDIQKQVHTKNIFVGRLIEGQNSEHTNIRVSCLDSNSEKNKIRAYFSKEPYVGKISSRTECQLVIRFQDELKNKILSEEEEKLIIEKINFVLKREREKTNSLFLPNYREGNRKRLPFELLYSIVKRLIVETLKLE